MAKKKDDTLFKFFDAANAGDFSFVDNMTDEQVKTISPFVLLGWGMGAKSNNAAHTIMTDAYMNDKVFSLQKWPRLLLKLFISANEGIDKTRYGFVKPTTASSKKEQCIADFYQCSLREAKDYAKILVESDIDEIVDLMEQNK